MSSSGPHKGALHVLVKEAKNLQPVKANGHCDAFCKRYNAILFIVSWTKITKFICHFSYLLPDKNRSSKQKTPVIKRTTSPVWNYTFIYEDVSLSELSERALELTLWDHDRLASNEFLGGVRFSLGTGMFENVVDYSANKSWFCIFRFRQTLRSHGRLDGLDR
jgi:synaptotagmin-like protein